ncbi:hypothetical protein B0O79_2926 [Flavobacteriaceae bacterium MAR_2009_75]|nr:hypothetical protein B0O79_2926 [Flavobacteriaceae bacterium MAR_2009_75]
MTGGESLRFCLFFLVLKSNTKDLEKLAKKSKRLNIVLYIRFPIVILAVVRQRQSRKIRDELKVAYGS